MDPTDDTVTQTVCDTMGWASADLRSDTPLQDCPGWDSVNQLRVLMALEPATGTRIPMKRFLAAATLNDIRALVKASSARGAMA